MKMLTPDEFRALRRLLTPPHLRPDVIKVGSKMDAVNDDLVEQGRATYHLLPADDVDLGHYLITEAGRLALKLAETIPASLLRHAGPPLRRK